MTIGRGSVSGLAPGRRSVGTAAVSLIVLTGLGIVSETIPATATPSSASRALGRPRATEPLTALGIYDDAQGDVKADWRGIRAAAGDVAMFSICDRTRCVRGTERGLTWTRLANESVVVEPDQLPAMSVTYSRLTVWISAETATGSRRISEVQTIRFAPFRSTIPG